MTIWHSVGATWNRIVGGWRTYGPGAVGLGNVYGDSDKPGDLYSAASLEASQRLSAVWACETLRAETKGTLPLHVRDKDKNPVTQADIYGILHDSPNSMMTAAEYWSLVNAHLDLEGNHISIVKRRVRDRSVISLEPMMSSQGWTIEDEKSGGLFYKAPDGEKFDPRDILHFRGFTTKGYWGMSRLAVGRAILSAQIEANDMAITAFKQGLKLGGFFEVDNNLTVEQREEWDGILRKFGRSEMAGKWMTLLKGMKPVSGAEYRPKATDAELLASRVFGIEEICRLFNVPPPLIGHADKASSWASSLEQLNLMFYTYSCQPDLIRQEQRIKKILFSPEERAKGLEAKFSMQAILRADTKTRRAFYDAGLRNGDLSINEVRDLEERAGIGPSGDVYRTQMQMVDVDAEPEQNTDEPKKGLKNAHVH